ncbi:hypothetical protein BO94DRAFT_545880 [Aspergillus sclerotioniger CBS 115572]|uniref:Uncharacterized protein n=1 Tax=Aspergillus sclerotioniger CBS 115572 TaxID=1450535 RepID=A0A317WU40_9EURO|nr:hypothetical protein BO94DRAFT_545880 [Aspergillus sclerotioniger CBS 115572]PWY88802.1 hypothetical protein BO94DRAFT_545880 [Aspergillus sclerotioniger CBS 115572]
MSRFVEMAVWSTGHSPSEARYCGLTLSPSGSSSKVETCVFPVGAVKASTAAEHWGESGTHHKTPGSRMYHRAFGALSFGWCIQVVPSGTAKLRLVSDPLAAYAALETRDSRVESRKSRRSPWVEIIGDHKSGGAKKHGSCKGDWKVKSAIVSGGHGSQIDYLPPGDKIKNPEYCAVLGRTLPYTYGSRRASARPQIGQERYRRAPSLGRSRKQKIRDVDRDMYGLREGINYSPRAVRQILTGKRERSAESNPIPTRTTSERVPLNPCRLIMSS